MFIYITLILAIFTSVTTGQVWREDYFKDEVMRFTTVECWQGQKVDPKPTGVTRIAVIGDSTTLGVGSSRSMLNFMYDYHFQFDGSKAGFEGYPYLLNSLLKVHNDSQPFQTINFANDNFTLYSVNDSKSYSDTCEYQQLLSSNPDIIISMLGAKESIDVKQFTPEKFVNSYKSFIEGLQKLPSSPLFILVSPIYGASSMMKTWKQFKLNELDGKNFDAYKTDLPNWQYNKVNMTELIMKVAQQTNIPEKNVIDSIEVIKDENLDTMNDTIHPNEHGYGVLAQEIYMRLAQSKQLNDRVNQIYGQSLTLDELANQGGDKGIKNNGKRVSSVELEKTILNMNQLFDECAIQSKKQAGDALIPTKNYLFTIPWPKPNTNEIRVAFLGDSVTQGCCGTTGQQISDTPMIKRLSDTTDGTQQGLQGYPYLLHELLRNNNKTVKYTFMNYGVPAATIIPDGGYFFRDYFQTCRYLQFQKSMPDVVFVSFGAMDTHHFNYTSSKFIENYVKLIKEAQDMPTKPMVFIVGPVFLNCQKKYKVKKVPKLNNYDWAHSGEECSDEGVQEILSTVQQVANMTGVPQNRVIDAFSLLRKNGHKEDGIHTDSMHPNVKGFGDIAQELFMRMSLSPEYLARQKEILSSENDVASFQMNAQLKKIKKSRVNQKSSGDKI